MVSVLRTSRLLLRAPADRDVPAIVTGCSDPVVALYIPVIPVPYTEGDAREWLAGADQRWRRDRERSLAITSIDEDDELLGVVSADLRPGGSVGYWMRADARGRGLMSEALIAVVQWAEEQHGLGGLFLTAHPENLASQRVAEKAGFTKVGIVEHDPVFRDGTTHALRFERRS
jgi:RimJ/RimL family protein N-acetyltransferase